MKRLFGVTIAVALLVGLSLSHLGWSAPGKGQPKVLICHATGNGGKVISVAQPAADAHLRHGDCLIVPAAGEAAPVAGTACDLERAPLLDDTVDPPVPVLDDEGNPVLTDQCAG